jgi:tRNA_anti-like
LNRKKNIWLIIILVAAAGAWYGYREYNRTYKDLQNTKPDFVLSAISLIHEYETGDSTINKKYNGKVIEVTGYVKNIEKDEVGFYTIILGDSISQSSVRCSMDTVHAADAANIVKGSSATIRGSINGFNKDETGLLGSDVILNYCAIISKKDN